MSYFTKILKSLRTPQQKHIDAQLPPFKPWKEFPEFCWGPSKEAIALREEGIASRQKIQELKAEIRQQNREYAELESRDAQLSEMLYILTESMQARVWRKNAYCSYLYANHLHCSESLGVGTSSDCLQYIIGKSDLQVLNEAIWDNGPCIISDRYTRETGHTSHFIEVAIEDLQEVLLYAIKTPQYSSENQFMGLTCIAWDITAISGLIMPMLKVWRKSNKIEVLYKIDDIFSYAIKDADINLFKAFYEESMELAQKKESLPDGSANNMSVSSFYQPLYLALQACGVSTKPKETFQKYEELSTSHKVCLLQITDMDMKIVLIGEICEHKLSVQALEERIIELQSPPPPPSPTTDHS